MPLAASPAPLHIGEDVWLPRPFDRCVVAAAWPMRPDFALWTLRHPRLGLLALKRFAPTRRARAQAARAARLQRQARGPFTLHMFAAWPHADGPLVLEPWARGPSLATLLDHERATHAAAPLGETLRRAEVMARAVADAHAGGVWHRDVKPDNFLMRTAAARPTDLRLCDFGLARTAHTPCRDGAGTLAYQAPEVALGGAHTQSADIFSLAASIIEMLVGMAPYEADSENKTLEALAAGAPLVREDDVAFVLRRGNASNEVVHCLGALLARASAPRLAERPTASAMVDVLARCTPS